MEDFRLTPGHRVEPLAVCVLWHNIAFHVVPFIVRTPEVFPILRLFQIPIMDIHATQAFRHLSDTIVVIGIFYGSCASSIDAIGQIAILQILLQSASSVLLMICSRIHFGIFQHCLKGKVIVDTLYTFHKGISDNHFCIRTALSPSAGVSTTGIRHITFSLIDIYERINDIRLTFLVYQRNERRTGTIGIPDGIVIIIIRSFCPFGILTCFIYRHQHRVIKGSIEHTLLLVCAINMNTPQQDLPVLTQLCQLGIKVTFWNIPLGLLLTDIRDADLYI